MTFNQEHNISDVFEVLCEEYFEEGLRDLTKSDSKSSVQHTTNVHLHTVRNGYTICTILHVVEDLINDVQEGYCIRIISLLFMFDESKNSECFDVGSASFQTSCSTMERRRIRL